MGDLVSAFVIRVPSWLTTQTSRPWSSLTANQRVPRQGPETLALLQSQTAITQDRASRKPSFSVHLERLLINQNLQSSGQTPTARILPGATRKALFTQGLVCLSPSGDPMSRQSTGKRVASSRTRSAAFTRQSVPSTAASLVQANAIVQPGRAVVNEWRSSAPPGRASFRAAGAAAGRSTTRLAPGAAGGKRSSQASGGTGRNPPTASRRPREFMHVQGRSRHHPSSSSRIRIRRRLDGPTGFAPASGDRRRADSDVTPMQAPNKGESASKDPWPASFMLIHVRLLANEAPAIRFLRQDPGAGRQAAGRKGHG